MLIFHFSLSLSLRDVGLLSLSCCLVVLLSCCLVVLYTATRWVAFTIRVFGFGLGTPLLFLMFSDVFLAL